ncbi:MAG TPA: hypothetical protein EYG03_15330 [Planctomycetes bacterium]|nr:hypothetical protein [Fuerstiella sp.]HIK93330.1 hypothetical protein [Planctomycetota bacterium]
MYTTWVHRQISSALEYPWFFGCIDHVAELMFLKLPKSLKPKCAASNVPIVTIVVIVGQSAPAVIAMADILLATFAN